jgi:hypothetical protein
MAISGYLHIQEEAGGMHAGHPICWGEA